MRTALVNDLHDWLRSILDFLMYNLNLNLNRIPGFNSFLTNINMIRVFLKLNIFDGFKRGIGIFDKFSFFLQREQYAE